MKPITYFLGICLNYFPGDIPLSDSLCRWQIEAQNRIIIPYDLEPDGMYVLNMKTVMGE